MQDLQLIGVHEDGEHLLLSGNEGGRFRMRVDEPLRAAVRHERPRLGQTEVDGGLRPRDVQALIRAGATAEEAAERAGWSVDKVHRYEGPILAEREHVAGLAREARLRTRQGGSSGAPTLSARVIQRLKGRGVDPTGSSWDAWRSEDGPWTVVLTFAAGGRQRQASWSFDLADKAVSAVDDEARWLSEEETLAAGPIPAPHLAAASQRATSLYDLEAEGGLQTSDEAEHEDPPIDLMTAMRERTTARSRRKPGSRRGSAQAPTNVPGAGDDAPDAVLPLDDLAYDPGTMAPPPAAHAEPDPWGVDGRPEPEVAALMVQLPEERLESTTAASAPLTKPTSQSTSKSAAGPARPRAARKGGRPTVPAWDEIMFGSRPGADRSAP